MKKYIMILILSSMLISCGKAATLSTTSKVIPTKEATGSIDKTTDSGVDEDTEKKSTEEDSLSGTDAAESASTELTPQELRIQKIRKLRELRAKKLGLDTSDDSGSGTSPSPSADQADCKSIDMTSYPSKITPETKSAMECINKAILSCNPATVKIIGTGTALLNIDKKEGENCIIGNEIIKKPAKASTMKYYSSCKFPIDKFLTPLSKSYDKNGQTKDLLWMGLSFIKGIDEPEKDSDGYFENEIANLDNETVAYKCK